MSITNMSGSESVLAVAVSTLLVSFVTMSLLKSKRKKGSHPYPPGPKGYPIIGHLPLLGKMPHLTFTEWAKEFGNVFSLRFGSKDVVILNSWKTVRQALVYQSEAFAGRPDFYSFTNLIANGKAIAFNTYSEKFRFQKKMVVNAVKHVWQNIDPPLEEMLIREADHMIEVATSKPEPFHPYMTNIHTCMYLICGIVFGFDSSLCTNREAIKKIGNLDKTRKEEAPGANICDFFPWLRPFLQHKFDGMIAETTLRLKIIDTLEKEHREDYDPEIARDVMDHLIKVSDELTEEQAASGLTKEHIMTTAFTLINASSDPMAGVLTWAYYYMAKYPEMQARLQAEVDSVVGERPPKSNDRAFMHYTEAFMNEVMRHSVFTVFLLPKSTYKDVVFEGHFIPENTVILANMWSVSRDKELWGEDADDFNPDRYITEDGEFNKKLLDNMYPFGAGKRRCVGEAIARFEMVLLVARLMQKVTIKCPPGETIEDITDYALTLLPYKYNVVFEHRPNADKVGSYS